MGRHGRQLSVSVMCLVIVCCEKAAHCVAYPHVNECLVEE